MVNTEYTHPANQVADGQDAINVINNKARQEIDRIGLGDELRNAGLDGWATQQEKQVQENNFPTCPNCNKDMRPIHHHDGADDYYEFWICDDCQFKLEQ